MSLCPSSFTLSSVSALLLINISCLFPSGQPIPRVEYTEEEKKTETQSTREDEGDDLDIPVFLRRARKS